MTRISIGNLSFNTGDFSEDLQAAVDLLLEVYLKEKIGGVEISASTNRISHASSIPLQIGVLCAQKEELETQFKKLGSEFKDWTHAANIFGSEYGLSSIGDPISCLEREFEDFMALKNVCSGNICDIAPFSRIEYTNHDESYIPQFGEFNKFLWVDPKIIHDRKKPLPGYSHQKFHRKCFMQLKTFSNLRFRR